MPTPGFTPMGAWERVAAVRRTVGWVRRAPERVASARYLGQTCGRLVDEAIAESDLPDAVRERLARARDLLAGWAALAEGERGPVLAELDRVLEEVVPAGQIGAQPLAVPARAELVMPGAARRREEPEKAREPEAPAVPPESEPPLAVPTPAGAAEAEALTAELSEDDDDEPSTGEAPEGERAGRGRRHRDRRGEPPPEELESSRRLVLGHPQGTGLELSSLPGIGAQIARACADAGLQTVADLLLRPPVAFDRPPFFALAPRAPDDALPAGAVVVRGKIRTRCTRLFPGGRRWEVVLSGADEARLLARWVTRPPRGWEAWHAGRELALAGEVREDDGALLTYEAEPVGIDGRGSGVLPVYGIPGADDRAVREAVASALHEAVGALRDWLPAEVVEAHRLLPLDEALRDAHFPANPAGRGRARMAFEELLLLQVGVAWRSGRGRPERGIAHPILHRAIGHLETQHGIKLDDEKEIAFSEIRRDLRRPVPMTRLLQGDVGTGKGLVALMTAIVVAEGGCQVAMVAPDPLAAERAWLYAEGLLRSVGIVPLLVGDRANHAQVDAIRRGEALVVFGTRCILDEEVAWKRLGLVVVEERGQVGTVPPSSLRRNGDRPDLLVVTRSPIPSSLAFSVFGEFDVSVVNASREGRVSSVTTADRAAAYARVREQIVAGRQGYVVFPVRDGRDLLGTEDALRMAGALHAEVLEGAKVGVYCSAMSRDERFRVYDDFQHRRIDVLVCTTFIEDAPAVDNATEMVVEYADMHDLVRLHRLRGHVAGGTRPGHCWFVLSDKPADGAREVVERVAEERDGFRLAEIDLQVRGPRALLGDRAAEVARFAWADPARDRDLLLKARVDAFRILRSDPDFRRNPDLARAVTARWGAWLGENVVARRPPDPRGRPKRRRRRRR